MAGKDNRRNMTVHRGGGRQRQGDRRPLGQPREASPMTLGEAGAVLMAAQTALCLLLVAGIFTVQFLSPGLFDRAGDYFLAVMGRQEEPAVEVGILDQPITVQVIQDYLDNAVLGVVWAAGEPKASPPEENLLPGAGGQGGESVWIPENLYLGPVAFSAKAGYPAYGVITSPFGMREHPVTGKDDFHTGIDIAGQKGDSIFAVLPAVVEEVGVSAIYGNFVTLRHGKSLATVYCHCDRILVAEGAVLRKGERIAEMGSTGVSTGDHLHFEVLVDGNYIDPMRMFGQ